MNKLTNWLEEKLFWLRTGSKLKIVNNGNPVNQTVIRHKDYYIEVMTDTETNTPCNLSWSTDPTVFHVPVREHYKTVKVFKKSVAQ